MNRLQSLVSFNHKLSLSSSYEMSISVIQECLMAILFQDQNLYQL